MTTVYNRPVRSELRLSLIVCAGYFLFFLLYFAPIVFQGNLIAPDDDRIQNLPAFMGQRCLWTPLLFAGWPLAADPLVQQWYPLAWLCHFIPLPCGWNIFVLLGYTLCGFCTYLFVKEITGSKFGAIFAGLTNAMSGYMDMSVRHTHLVHAAFMLPLLLLCIERLRKEQSLKWIYSGAFVLALLVLNGHMQALAYYLALAGLYTIFRLSPEKEGRQRFLKSAALLFGCGLMLGMIQLGPTWELTRFSARNAFKFADFLTFSMHPLQAIGIFLPYLTGGPWLPYFGTHYFGLTFRPPLQSYFGILPLFFICASAALLRSNRQIVFWWVIGLLSFLLCFGDATPLGWILFHMPLFGMFRALHRLLGLSTLSIATICGIVIAQAQTQQLKSSTLTKAAMIVVMSFIAWLFVGQMMLEALQTQEAQVGAEYLAHAPLTNPALIMPVVFVTISLGCFLLWLKRTDNRVRQVMLLLVLAADLGFAGWFCEWNVSPVAVSYLEPPQSALKLRPLLESNRQRIMPVRGGSGERDELPPNISRYWEIASVSGYQPLMLTRIGRMLDMTEGGFFQVPWTLTAGNRSLDVLAVRYLTCPIDDQRLSTFTANRAPIFRKLFDINKTAIWENTRAMPRCWLVYQTAQMSEDDVLKTVRSGALPDGTAFKPAVVALIESKAGNHQLEQLPAPVLEDRATIKQLENERVTVEVECKEPKFLVLSDIYYPGWKATVDGNETQIERCDYLLRGLKIDAGRHTVVFEYQPASFWGGAATSLITLFVMLGCGVLPRKNRVSGKQLS